MFIGILFQRDIGMEEKLLLQFSEKSSIEMKNKNKS